MGDVHCIALLEQGQACTNRNELGELDRRIVEERRKRTFFPPTLSIGLASETIEGIFDHTAQRL